MCTRLQGSDVVRRLIVFLVLLVPALAGARDTARSYSDYLDDTLQGLERVRGDNGLPRDAVLVARDGTLRPPRDVAGVTSPSNIGLDLLLQIDLLDRAPYRDRARANIDKSLSTLDQLPFHKDSGLFFSWYFTTGVAAAQRDVSSVDNLHLAIGLWAVAQKLPGTPAASVAHRLFARMDFSAFVDKTKGVLGGNLRFLQAGNWALDSYRYDYFGSETRGLYSAGAAIGIRGLDRGFLESAIDKLTTEMATPYGQRILRTWDGGTFQLFLPELLLGESRYSREMTTTLEAYAEYAWREGQRRGLPVPATHSACVVALDPFTDDPKPDDTQVKYEGQAGSRAVGNRQATQIFDDSTIAVHALLLTATVQPQRFLPTLDRLAAVNGAYRKDLGFVDSVRIRAEDGKPEERALPIVLALDKEMEALALLRILSPDQATASSRLLAANPATHAELTHFYFLVDKKLSAATAIR